MMLTQSHKIWILVLAAACCTAACRDRSRNDGSGARCETREDCRSGLVCGPKNTCIRLDPNNLPEGYCTTNDHCAREEYCNQGICDPIGTAAGCTTDVECLGQRCQLSTGTCVRCLSADDCSGGMDCQSNQCVSLGNPCASDGDCAPTEYCNPLSGRCAARAQNPTCTAQSCGAQLCNSAGVCVECLNNTHCTGGQICRSNGTCGSTPIACQSDSDCAGRVCEVTTQTCVDCLSSADCPAGQSCQGKFCVGEIYCTNQADCTSQGKVCDVPSNQCVACDAQHACPSGTTCQGGLCLLPGGCQNPDNCGGSGCYFGSCTPCSSDNMCADATNPSFRKLICNSATGQCVDPQCTTAADCAAGQACFGNGHCGTCLYDNECRPGEACQLSSGLCEASTSCSSNAQCSAGKVCRQGACVTCQTTEECDAGEVCSLGQCIGGGGGNLGDTCGSTADCGGGRMCLAGGPTPVCSQLCIASGKAGGADCPTGYACEDYETGPLDGLAMCRPASHFAETFPGYPFDQLPGQSCASHNGCQNSLCFTGTGNCARSCRANRDCNAGEVCYAKPTGVGGTFHLCYGSDTSQYLPEGGLCGAGAQCDSGVCVGVCPDNRPCNDGSDCAAGQSCTGVCRDHCRSNADCAAGQSCNPWATNILTRDNSCFEPEDCNSWTTVCTPKFFNGTQADGTSCTSPEQCSSDWCIGGLCTSPCALSADCTGALNGKQCLAVPFVNGAQEVLYTLAFCL